MTASPNMTNLASPSTRFIAEFMARRAGFGLRIEHENDKPFLSALFIACSPLAAALPATMVEQQALMQDQNYAATFPAASRYIILRGAESIGRMIVDWEPDQMTHTVDLAILPSEQSCGIGTDLLTAWIATSQKLARDCQLQVFATNPAKNLYQRLGFVAVSDAHEPSITMIKRHHA